MANPLARCCFCTRPGHDTDSCSYLDTRTQTLITGDSLQLNGTASQGCALLMDVPAYRATLERLMALPVECIVCGHDYLPLGDGAVGREKVRRFLLECFACFAHDRGFVAGMAAAGETDPAAIAKALIQHIGGTMAGIPVFTHVHRFGLPRFGRGPAGVKPLK